MFNGLKEIYKNTLVWDEATIYLYLFIIFSTTILSNLACKYKKDTSVRFLSNPFYLLSFSIFLFFLVFRDVGTDLPMYRTIYNNSDLGSSFFNSQEPGFMLLNRIMKCLEFSDNVAIGIFGFFTVFLYFYIIEANSRIINVPIAIFAYGCLYYFQSYSLIRMYLASAILIFATQYLSRGEIKKYSLIVFCTIFIHYSAILAFLPLTFILLYRKRKRYFYWAYIILIFIGIVVINYITNIPIFERYNDYLSTGQIKGGIGLFQIAINIPLLMLYYYCKKKIRNNTFLDIFFVYTLSALLVGMFSYKIMMIGRSLVYYNILYILCIPSLLKRLKILKDRNYKYICLFFYVFIYWRFYQYLGEYLYFDRIMPYKFIDIL